VGGGPVSATTTAGATVVDGEMTVVGVAVVDGAGATVVVDDAYITVVVDCWTTVVCVGAVVVGGAGDSVVRAGFVGVVEVAAGAVVAGSRSPSGPLVGSPPPHPAVARRRNNRSTPVRMRAVSQSRRRRPAVPPAWRLRR